jgi:arylsulfatase A-like enzyme
MRSRRPVLVLVVAMLAVPAIPSVAAATPARAVTSAHVAGLESVAADTAAAKPNFLVILTDDQRWDTLWSMPKTRALIAEQGERFTNAFVVNPLCCPSRASILTGLRAEHTDVWRNAPPHGGFPSFTDDSTVATWLDDAGYRTGFFGKYLNEYDTLYVPPGWDRWVAFNRMPDGGGAYYDYDLNVDGTLVHHGYDAASYSTDLFSRLAQTFIRNTAAGTPLFAYFAPYAPHSPMIPATRHRSAFSGLAPYRPPSFNEEDVSDKPTWVRNLPRLTAADRAEIDASRRNGYRSLQAVDDAVAALIDALADEGRLGNTMIVFMSDNGHSWGEHRWRNKQAAYEEDIRIPMLIRYDPVTDPGVVDYHTVLNIDIAPTIAAAAGLDVDVDGENMIPILGSATSPWRTDFAIDHLTGGGVWPPVSTYCAVRNGRYTYVRYRNGDRELYVLAADPYQRFNKAKAPAWQDEVAVLDARMLELCGSPPIVFGL